MAPLGDRGPDLRIADRQGPEEAAESLGAPLPILRQTLDLLVQKGALLRVKDLFFDRAAVMTLRERLVAYLKEHREIAPPQWKELCGATRKYTIPLAEYFDAEKVTLRIGDLRRLRG